MSLPSPMGSRGGYFVLSCAILVADQLTKFAADSLLRGRDAVVVIPGCLSLWYSRNPGGLFGYFRDWPDPWRSLLLTALPFAAIILIAVFLVRSQELDRPTLYGLALILGGATGNLVDRIFRGEVVDFLDVYIGPSRLADKLLAWFGTSHWPTFNVGDSAIVVGAGLLVLSIVRPQPAQGTDGPSSPAEPEQSSPGR